MPPAFLPEFFRLRIVATVTAVLAAVGPVAPAAPPTIRLDLDTAPPTVTNEVIPGPGDVTRIYGYTGLGNAGIPLSGGFDVDGDGWNDTAFAQLRASPSGTSSGQVTVIFGDGTIGTDIDTALMGPNILLVEGTHEFEVVGAEAWMDDVTGDGLGDLIIGRQNYTVDYGLATEGARGAGALTIILGDPDLRPLGTLDLAAPPASIKMITLLGASDYDRLGIWVRTGDVDGDGLSDIAVGADETDESGAGVGENSGAVWVIRGGAHLVPSMATPHVVVDLANFGSTILEGNLARLVPPAGPSNEHFGATVQVGDLDGNGRAEVLVAATLNRAGAGLTLPSRPFGTGQSSGGLPNGALFISWDENFPPYPWPAGYSFTVTEPVLGDFTRIDGLNGPNAQGEDNDDFGEEIITGEFSGDGFPDLYSGDLTAETVNGTNSGMGHLFYTAANLRGRTINMTAPPADVVFTTIYGPFTGAIGNDTVAEGDFDADGIDDLAVGNPHDRPQARLNAGTVHVMYGQAGGWPAVVDTANGALPGPTDMRIAQIDGALSDDVLCYSAASGDINHDGVVDFIVNEMKGHGSGGSPADVGNLLVINADALLDPFAPSLSFGVAGPVEFGAQDVAAGATASVMLSATNTSGAAVTISSLALAGPQAAAFTIMSDTGEAVLSPGASRTLALTFDPAALGRHGAAVSIVTATDAHAVAIGLRGTGIDPAIEAEVVDYIRFGGEACIRFRSQMGFTYVLRRSTDLVNWTTIQSGIEGSGGIVPLFDTPGPGGAKQYYQVIGTPTATP